MFDKITEKFPVKELEALDAQGKAPSEALTKAMMQSAMVCRNE